MTWKVIAYESARKEKLVKDFIKSLENETRSKVGRLISLLQIHGNLLRMPYSKKITKDIFELRIRGVDEIRIFYAFGKGKVIYLLHGFKKKSQKTSIREIIIAEKRLKEALDKV